MALISWIRSTSTQRIAADLTRATNDVELAAQVAEYIDDLRRQKSAAEASASELREWKRRSIAARKGRRKAGA